MVGPGGIGKTRLALQSAADQRDLFVHGVAFVPLAAVAAAERIVPAITEALGCTLYGSSEPKVQLLHYLHEKQLLLVLDNVEQVLEGVGLMIEILQHAPEVRLLITSREPLEVQGEWVFPVSGLPVPADAQVEGFEEYPAVALFLQRARRVHVGFVVDAEARSSVARICRLVEGMPLGLELAAAWVRTLACHEIAEEIERNIDFLATSRRDAPERQRSVRAVFDHSWTLLAEEDQRVLRQLSVFRGGFRRAAAVQVTGASLRVLAGLIDKSLISLTPDGRYHLNELLRQFSADKLTAAPLDQPATCERQLFEASLALNHPTTRQVYKDNAARLLTELEIDLPPEARAMARQRGQAQAVEDVIAAILGQARPNIPNQHMKRLTKPKS